MKPLAWLTSILLIAAGAFGGYLVGDSSGEDPDAARVAAEVAGQKVGAAVAAGRGFNAGFHQGREAAYPEAYVEAYRSAYRRAWDEEGLQPPSASELRASDISVPLSAMSRLTLGLTVLALTCAAAFGGYLLGSANAPGSQDSGSSEEEAFEDAFAESLFFSLSEARIRGERAGAAVGRRQGERSGSRSGYLAGQTDAEASVLATTDSREAELGFGPNLPGSGGVLVVGDSLEELTGPYLPQYLPRVDLTHNAVGGYSSIQIFELFQESYDPSQSVIVFDAGTNDNPNYPEILASNLEAVAEIVGDRCMVVPTIHGLSVNGVDSSGKNAVVTAFASSRPGTQVPDWANAVATHPELMQPDNLHPLPEGAALRARLIARAVRTCLRLGGVS